MSNHSCATHKQHYFIRIIKQEDHRCNLLVFLFAFAEGESKRQDLEGREAEWDGRGLVFLRDAELRSYSLHAVTFFHREHWQLYAQSERQTKISPKFATQCISWISDKALKERGLTWLSSLRRDSRKGAAGRRPTRPRWPSRCAPLRLRLRPPAPTRSRFGISREWGGIAD